MRKAAPILAAISLSICLGLLPQSPSAGDQDPLNHNSESPLSIQSVTADTNDSDEFFQSAIRSRGPERDYSLKIEAFLRQMTVEEKVGIRTFIIVLPQKKGFDHN